jgi:hypothetical protein
MTGCRTIAVVCPIEQGMMPTTERAYESKEEVLRKMIAPLRSCKFTRFPGQVWLNLHGVNPEYSAGPSSATHKIDYSAIYCVTSKSIPLFRLKSKDMLLGRRDSICCSWESITQSSPPLRLPSERLIWMRAVSATWMFTRNLKPATRNKCPVSSKFGSEISDE